MDGTNSGSMRARPRAHHWGRTEATKQRILDAAVDVFSAEGFTAATMAEIVTRSGASVGSVYHHFGGKDELFMAIHHRVADAAEQNITEASEAPGGLERPHLFDRHARAYLDVVYAHRHAARVLAAGDWPADYDRFRRLAMLDRFRRWAAVLDLANSRRDQLLYRILVALMAESVVIVSNTDSDEEAAAVVDDVVEYVKRLTH